MGDALKVIAAVGALILGTTVVVLLAMRGAPAVDRAAFERDLKLFYDRRPAVRPVQVVERAFHVFKVRKTECQYVVAVAGDDLYVVSSGGARCPSHVIVDGVRLSIDRRAALTDQRRK